MIVDLGQPGPQEDVRADVCIVGAGAAGITLARALSGSGLSICLVESGGLKSDPQVEALNEGESCGHVVEFTEGRARGLGGTTTKWTGRCTPFDPEDLEPRDWLPSALWPIPYDEVARYHQSAQIYCGFPWRWSPDARVIARLSPPPVPRFAASRVSPFVWRYAPRGARRYQDWGKRFRRPLRTAHDTRVMLNATLTEFHVSSDDPDRIDAITVRALSGAAARVSARVFVLCCGGVEYPALLLEGKRATGAAFGDSGDQVGRCFQQHVRGVIATVDVDRAGSRRLQELFNVFLRTGGVQHEIGFRLSSEIQRAERLLNASAFMSYVSDPASGWDSAKKAGDALLESRFDAVWPNLGRAATRPWPVIENLFRRGTDRHAFLATERIEVVVDLEQEPDPESRVTLSDRRDAFGRGLPRVDWRINERERTTAARFAAVLRDEFQRLGLGAVKPAAWLDPATPLAEAPVTGTHHHMATTRMSETASNGVVDRNCKVHDMANLYVGGCSVFATGGHANPTFMIVALALRLADHLRATLSG